MGVCSRRPLASIAAAVSAALRTFPFCGPALLLGAPAAQAQVADRSILTADIPEQSLAQALAAFAHQTGMQLIYVSDIVRNRKSHAVGAGLSAADALDLLLQGTGLRFQFLTTHSVRILAVIPRDSAAANPPGAELDEVIVTANRREESLQDVPITVQVLSGAQLSELNLTTFSDLLRYTPNVTYSGNGPGTGNIFIRGLGAFGSGTQSQATIAPFPNVALYLDEAAMQFPARNNDLYLVDLERVEVLEGPQGTLFGGGAQAGVIRYITNKPQLTATAGEFAAAYGSTAGGDPNTLVNATFNLPLLPDRLAVRAVAFVERRGGYITNVPGTISFDFPSTLPDGPRQVSPVANNGALVGPNTNPVTYDGARLSALYRFNDHWDLLIQQSYQQMDAEGYFYAYPLGSNGQQLRPDQITAFTPAYNKDRYANTAWTVNERSDTLRAIYTGSYMVRRVEEQQDYSNYLRSAGGAYYDCIGPGAGYFNSATFPRLAAKPLQCYAPVGNWNDRVRNEHHSHEVRLGTNEESRLRGLVGAYWERLEIDDDMNFNYLGIPQCSPANLAVALAGGPDCLSAVGPLIGSPASDPHLRENTNDAFGEDVQRGYKQVAAFASIDFDIIPKILTVTAGTRHYHYDEFEEGSVWYTLTGDPLILDHPNGACTAAHPLAYIHGRCGIALNLSKSESGFRSRGNLTWHVTPDIMAYYTFSQGFRPGAFNRAFSLAGQAPRDIGIAAYCGPASLDPRCLKGGSLYHVDSSQLIKPAGYSSDNLINNEIGLKSEILDHRLRVNASAYLMRWDDVQSPGLGPAGSVGVFNPFVNGPSYTVKGVELQVLANVGAGLTLQAVGSWNSAKQTSIPCLRSSGITPVTPNNPTPAGECITVVNGAPYELGVLDTPAPFSSPVIFNFRTRYDWRASACNLFAWVGVSHMGASSNEPANFPDGNAPAPVASTLLKYPIPAYTTYDGALGVSKDGWTVRLTGSNLANSNAATNVTFAQFVKATVPLRPRVMMAEFVYQF